MAMLDTLALPPHHKTQEGTGSLPMCISRSCRGACGCKCTGKGDHQSGRAPEKAQGQCKERGAASAAACAPGAIEQLRAGSGGLHVFG